MNEKVTAWPLRENLRKYKRALAEVINLENERLSRTIITGTTARWRSRAGAEPGLGAVR